MWKPISIKTHGAIDYAYAAIVPLLPELAGFSREQKANLLCKALGAGALTYSLLTRAPWGLIRILPFRSHLVIDFSVSCLAIASPWILGFSRIAEARNAVVAVGISGLTASLLTDPAETEYAEYRHLFI